MNETVLQFGAGRFLRGFIDRFISQLNERGLAFGKVVVVQSTAGRRAQMLNECEGGFPVVVQGYQYGERVEREEWVDSISRALVAEDHWSDVLEVARSPHLRWIVSNATEAGDVCSEQPRSAGVPDTMPAKLTAVLEARFQAEQPPLAILPCELISRNAERLRELVLRQAESWGLSPGFRHYAGDQCVWVNNLVDCMISDLPEDDPRRREHPLAIMAEPYALLAIEGEIGAPSTLAEHPAVRIVEDLEPYYLRKVRVLNGVHTAMVARYYSSPLDTVQKVLDDAAGMRWARDLLYGEVLPTLVGRVDGAVAFIDMTLERFRNPFMAHRLADIRLNHEQKVTVRLVPTAADYRGMYGTSPPLLESAIQANVAP